MFRVHGVSRCAVWWTATILFPAIAAAQDENLFGPVESEGGAPAQAAPAELEPEPALAPAPAVDPAPAGEIALPAIVAARTGAPNDFCRCVGEESSTESAARIRAVLQSPLRGKGLHFTDYALESVIGIIQEEYGIPIKLDTAALDDLGVQPDQPVTNSLSNISLRSALRLMLKELGLTYIIEDEVLLITTPDEAESHLKVCVYDVRDLVDVSKPADIDALRDTIVSCVAKETWAADGKGEAEIRPLRSGLLVVSQTQAVHERLRDTLNAIRTQQAARRAAAPAAPA